MGVGGNGHQPEYKNVICIYRWTYFSQFFLKHWLTKPTPHIIQALYELKVANEELKSNIISLKDENKAILSTNDTKSYIK